MKKTIIITLISSLIITTNVYSINLKQYIDQMVAAHDQLVASIKSLQDGKAEIGKIYDNQLKPQLFDTIDGSINDIQGNGNAIRSAIEPLQNLPSWLKPVITKVTVIDDLQPTLQWTIDNPLKLIQDQLQNVEDKFKVVADELATSDQAAQTQQQINAIYADADSKNDDGSDKYKTQKDKDNRKKDADNLVALLKRQNMGGAMYANFDIAIAKLQAAVCNMEKTMRALRADFTPYPACIPEKK